MTDIRSFDDDTTDLFGPRPSTAAKAEPIAATPVRPRRTVFAGYTTVQLLIGAAVLVALIWCMWVTKTLIGEPPQRVVKADLSRIVGDYVTVQARSGGSPEQVQAQTREFMTSLDAELQRRGAQGQVVLVGEAVLTKSVPDITRDVVSAVYASGVKRPQPANAAQGGALLGQQGGIVGQAAPQQMAQAPTVGSALPQAARGPFVPMPGQAPVPTDPTMNPLMAGPAVSTFGGPVGK